MAKESSLNDPLYSKLNNNDRGGVGCLNVFCNPSTNKIRGEGRNVSLMRYRIEMCRMFQDAMRCKDWKLAESLILSADHAQTLNDFLCKTVEFIWFLKSRHELDGITGLIKKIVSNGASNFMKAVVTTSFLASCLAVYENLTMNLENILAIMVQRVHDRIQKSNWDEIFKVKVRARVQNFTKWALKCIEIHCQSLENKGNGNRSTINDVQFQLSAFKAFLDLAGNNLSIRHFNEAFRAACFLLTHLPGFDPGWSSGISAYFMQGLLTMLVEGGANNVNRSLLEASQLGSTELVRIILQIARQKNLVVDVEFALRYASQFGKIRTMECLVEKGQATAFLKPLCSAAKQGCMPVVQWFVSHGCQNGHLSIALAIAASNSQVEITTYLLDHIPLHFLTSKRVQIINITYKLGGDSLQGVSLLLQLNFLGDSAATYTVADNISGSDDETVAHKLKVFLEEQWSEKAFLEGMREGKDHYVNLMRILKRGESAIWLGDLPTPLLMAIAYLPLYRECVEANGRLLPQRLRGQLVEVTGRLTNGAVNRGSQFDELLAVLEHQLSVFVHSF